MTLQTEINRWSYAADGVADSFDYERKITSASDLSVYLISGAGVEYLQTLGVDYSLSGVGANAGGTVIFVTPPANGYTVLIYCAATYTQPTDLLNAGRFLPESHQNAFDRLAGLIQQLNDRLKRTFRFSIRDEEISDARISDALNKFPYIGADGELTFVSGDPSDPVTHDVHIVTPADGATVITVPAAYTPGSYNLSVYLNGVKLVIGDDYTESSTTTITLTNPATSGDVIEFDIGTIYDVTLAQSSREEQSFTGLTTSTITLTTISYTPNTNSLDVYMNGVRLAPSQYTETNTTTITLAFTPISTDEFTVVVGRVMDVTTVSRNNVGLALYPITAAEIAAGVTPSDYAYAPGDVRRYGAVLDGVTDDSAAWANACAANKKVQGWDGTLYITSAPTITQKIVVTGHGDFSIIKLDTSLTHAIKLTSGADRSILQQFTIQGSKSASGGVVQRGVWVQGAKHCDIRKVRFSGSSSGTGLNFGVDIEGQSSAYTKVRWCEFERLVSSANNGTAILIEYSHHCHIVGNVIDGSESAIPTSAGAAIFLSSQQGGDGCTRNVIRRNVITAHPQVGIALNSTTYYEFSGNLGACELNRIEQNEISYCSAASGGDASSGISVVSNSNRNIIKGNLIEYNGHATNGGYGIVIAASAIGAASPGNPKLDEIPLYNQIIGNTVAYNKDTGIRINGAKYTRVQGNLCYENGQRTADTFYSIQVVYQTATVNGEGTIITRNDCVGSQPRYQIHVGASTPNTRIGRNDLSVGTTGTVLDEGTGTIIEYTQGNGGAVASASTITLPFNGDVFTITGTTSITSVTATGCSGRTVTLIFAGILTFTDGSNLKLAGNFVTSADDVITLTCDGTSWYEVSRSTN